MTSDHLKASLNEIENLWSLDDVMDAHAVLDAVERAEARAAKART